MILDENTVRTDSMLKKTSIRSPADSAESPASPAIPEDPFADSPKPKIRRALIGKCNRTCAWLTAGLGVGGIVALMGLDPEDAEQVGDITQLIPAVSGLTMTVLARDKQGLIQWSLAGGTSLVVTHEMKNAAEKARPNEGDKKSFPSGHTSASFFGASFIHERYGLKWGLPAYMLAGYTGLSRMNAEKHFGDDVVSGMSVGLMSNWLWTTPIDERFKISPIVADRTYGLRVAVDPFARPDPREVDKDKPPVRPPLLRYEWGFGDVSVEDNLLRSPGNTGDLIDYQFQGQSDPTVSGHVDIEWYPERSLNHGISFRLTPFEFRDFGQFDQPTDFAGITFPAGVYLRSGFVAYDFRLGYRCDFFPTQPYSVIGGVGAAALYTFAELAVIPEDEEQEEPDTYASDSTSVPSPLLHLHLDHLVSRRFLLLAEVDGMDIEGHRYLDATAQVRIQISRNWDVGLGYRILERTIDTTGIQNELNRRHIDLAVGYRW